MKVSWRYCSESFRISDSREDFIEAPDEDRDIKFLLLK